MKSIRKCDEKVTAQQLGVKVGDKFVVLSPEESYKESVYREDASRIGDVIELIDDDWSNCPRFRNLRTGSVYYETFSCLARHEESKEASVLQEEPSLQNVKFDMKAIAEELGVSLEKAHNIVQTALFERDVSWYDGKHIKYTNSDWLFVDKMLTYDDVDAAPEYKLMSIKSQYSFCIKEEVETIEFNGKQYNKEDVAKALALLSPVN